MSHALVEGSANNPFPQTKTDSSKPVAFDLRDLLAFDGEDSRERSCYNDNGVLSADNLVSLFFNSIPIWDGRAACSIETSHFFHDYDDDSRSFLYETEAKALCAKCEVRELCLKESLKVGDVYSICGGLTPLERAKLYPKAFDASINVHVRNMAVSKSSGRHIKRRAYKHKITTGTTSNFIPLLDSSFFTSGTQLSLFPTESDSSPVNKNTVDNDRFDFPAKFRRTLRFPRNSTLKTTK